MTLQDVRESLEHELFVKDRDLFSQDLDLVFIDTTSTFVYHDALQETPLRRRGYSRDRRGDPCDWRSIYSAASTLAPARSSGNNSWPI